MMLPHAPAPPPSSKFVRRHLISLFPVSLAVLALLLVGGCLFAVVGFHCIFPQKVAYIV